MRGRGELDPGRKAVRRCWCWSSYAGTAVEDDGGVIRSVPELDESVEGIAIPMILAILAMTCIVP